MLVLQFDTSVHFKSGKFMNDEMILNSLRARKQLYFSSKSIAFFGVLAFFVIEDSRE